MSKEHAAFLRTFGAMEPGDALQLVGGTFPREGQVAQVAISLVQIIPSSLILGAEGGHIRPNPAFREGQPDPVWLDLRRNDQRFRADFADPLTVTCAPNAGLVLGHTVGIMIAPLQVGDAHFIVKPPAR